MNVRRVLFGAWLGLPGLAAGVVLSVLRGGDASNTPLQEVIGGLPVAVVPVALGIACALSVERWSRGHLLPVALGVVGAMVVVSVAGQNMTGDPTYLLADSEGNVDVEPGAYIVLALFAAGLATARWWPHDRSAVVLTALSATTVTYWWWLPALPDTSGPGWPWLWLVAGLLIATVALPARRWVPWAAAGATCAAILWAGFVTGYFRYPPGAWGAFIWLLAIFGAPGALVTVHAARLAAAR